MKLPNVKSAMVPKSKVADYLLSPVHHRGKDKAVFFATFGFARERWKELREALRAHAWEHEVSKQEESVFGVRYSIDGIMLSPGGDRLNIRTAWFIDKGGSVPRFITAHPLEKGNGT